MNRIKLSLIGLLILTAETIPLNCGQIAFGTENSLARPFSRSQFPSQRAISRIEAKLNSPFHLKHSQGAYIPNEKVEVNFLRIVEDSRCPSDVTCFWSGQVTVELSLIRGEQNLKKMSLTLSPGKKELAIQSYGQYVLQLIEVVPYPKSTKPIAASDYSVTLVLSKKKS